MHKEDKKAQAKFGDNVRVHFTCKLEDGTTFDTSAGKEPLQFTIGQDQVMKVLEHAVIGMHQGETKKVTINADDVFGRHLKEKVSIVNRDQFPPDLQPVIGMKFEIKQSDGSLNVIKITDVTESTVTMDANHPLAGKNLYFDIELLELKIAEPDHSDEYYKKAVDFQSRGLLDEAIPFYQKAIESNPKHSKAFFNLGVALQQKGFIDKAILYYEVAIGINQDFVEAHHNLGVAYNEKGLFDEAIVCFQRTVQLKTDHPGAYYNLGNALVAKGQFQEALQCYEKAIELLPDFADAHWAIALLKLRFGNFHEGWKGYEWRWKLKDIIAERNFKQPRWDGSNIAGKTILLHAEQGLGDTLQFIRYAPIVSRQGVRVIIECQKELVSLLQSVQGVDHVLAQDESLPEFDIHCPLLSLPSLLNTTLENIPNEVPYIMASSSLVEKWKKKLLAEEHSMRIGLAWSGDQRLKFGQDRSCPLENFSPLGEMDNIIFYSLQKGGPSRQVFTPPGKMRIIDYAIELDNFSETSALIQNLDLVISVDTAVAHLAGAIGKPVWVLLPFVADWRWMLERQDSPWYPTMKLFIQPSRGDWDSVIKVIAEELLSFREKVGQKP